MSAESDGRELHLGVTTERVTLLRGLAKSEANTLLGDALGEAMRFYDLVREAWQGTREEYAEVELERDKVRLELSTASAENTRLKKKIDAATLLLERAMKPTNRPELVREALEKLWG
jgi:hypothetical protein